METKKTITWSFIIVLGMIVIFTILFKYFPIIYYGTKENQFQNNKCYLILTDKNESFYVKSYKAENGKITFDNNNHSFKDENVEIFKNMKCKKNN